jgi:hypothetical protein
MPKPGFIPNEFLPWIEARKRHHLSHAAIQMARELGMNPKKFGKIDNQRGEVEGAAARFHLDPLFQAFRQGTAGRDPDDRRNRRGKAREEAGAEGAQGREKGARRSRTETT